MVLSHQLGRDGDAIKAYARLKNALAQDLDVTPAAALTDLYHTLRKKK